MIDVKGLDEPGDVLQLSLTQIHGELVQRGVDANARSAPFAESTRRHIAC